MSHELNIDRLVDGSADDVFDAFVDPDAQKRLFAEGADWIVESECDLRVGGLWTISFGPPGRAPASERNVFTAVDRPSRLAFRSRMTMFDGSTCLTEVEVAFLPEGDRTRVAIVQRGFLTATVRDTFADGWGGILDGLGPVVLTRVAGSR